jgi:uncharacterized RmlC-like cupin family protein
MVQSTEQKTEMQAFKCELPDDDFQGRPKKTARIVGSKLLGMGLQVVLNGGETNRHAHNNQDAIWLVLEGRARFYGATDEDVFEAGPHEGVFIPMASPYWFESASDEPLKILRIAATDKDAPAGRTNYEELKDWQGHLAAR